MVDIAGALIQALIDRGVKTVYGKYHDSTTQDAYHMDLDAILLMLILSLELREDMRPSLLVDICTEMETVQLQ